MSDGAGNRNTHIYLPEIGQTLALRQAKELRDNLTRQLAELEPAAVWSGPHTQWTYGYRDPQGGTVIWMPMAESEARRQVARLREHAAEGVRYAVLRTEIGATVEDDGSPS